MRTVYGKQVLETRAERIAPQHTALIVIDMQNDSGHPDGFLAATNSDVSQISKAAAAIAELVESARVANMLVVWLKRTSLLGGRSESGSSIAFRSTSHGVQDPVYLIQGTWGHEIMAPLKPAAGEPVIVKFRPSGFTQTPLDLILRCNGIRTVVLCGCVTEGCVGATARSALSRDYYTEVVGDCVASRRPDVHEAALTVLRRSCHGVAERDVYSSIWRDANPEGAL